MRKVFIALLVICSIALIGITGYILYTSTQTDTPVVPPQTTSSSSSTTSQSTSSSTSSIDIPVADEAPLICGAEGSDITVDFEDLVGTSELTNISNEYSALGFTFRNGERLRAHTGESGGACSQSTPVLARSGTPTIAFQPNDQLGSSFRDRQGDYFITDTGSIGGTPCQLIIDFSKPTYEFSFDLYDIDNSESWLIEAYDQAGNVLDSVVADSGGSAKPKLVSLESTTSIVQIRVSANSNYSMNSPIGGGSGWGLAFDNFRPYCVEEPPVPPAITKSGTGVQIANGEARIGYSITVNNPDDETVENVIVTDTLPSYIKSAESISNGGSLSGRTITWNIPSIAAGGTVTLTYAAVFDVVDLPTEGGQVTISNTAAVYVDANQDGTPDDEEKQDEDTEETDVDLDAAAQLVKSATASENGSGDLVANYTIRISNTGEAPLSNYSVVDTYSDNIQDSWISNISNSGVLSGGQITWEGLSVAVGQSLSLTYTVTIPAGTEGSFQNVAILYDENDEEVDSDGETVYSTNTLPDTGLFDDSRTLALFMIGMSLILLGLLVNRLDAQLGWNLFKPYEDKILDSQK